MVSSPALMLPLSWAPPDTRGLFCCCVRRRAQPRTVYLETTGTSGYAMAGIAC